MSKKLFIFGCGYSCSRLGQSLLDLGWEVFGTIRCKKKATEIQSLGITPVFFYDEERINKILADEISILVSIPPVGDKDIVLEKFSSSINLFAKKINWLGYLSTTGVYGNYHGEWVDEESSLNSRSDLGKNRILAEKNWIEISKSADCPLYIFRLAGIYGPERSYIERLQKGVARKIITQDHYFNRIHVDDISGIVIKALNFPNLADIYNVSDDLPCPGYKVVEEAARLLNISTVEEIDFKDAQLSEMAKSFYLESKRISNRKLKEKLNYGLLFPNYKKGLLSILKKQNKN
ncbi:MAG: SDR family oxidoreductase [Pseudomonadota bacterium]|nr:SDR family oxidoreductase [Pseudomonadota bacterium]